MKPIDIIIATYNRRSLLQKTIEGIEARTKTPYRLIVVDNCSKADDTILYLKSLKKSGRISVLLLNDKNVGASQAFNKGFEYVESELFITTDDDIVPPDLEPDWLEQLICLFNKYYPEYGTISLRQARMVNVYFAEEWIPHYPNNELGESRHSSCSWLRIQKKSDVEKIPSKFGGRMKFSSLHFNAVMRNLGFRRGYAKNIWAHHTGYGAPNKGYPKGFTDYARYSKNKAITAQRKPYPKIDPKTHVPI